MKLVTFQSIEALTYLVNNGYLVCDENHIDMKKASQTYNWISEKMNSSVSNPENIKYPLWCWVKYKKSTCPPKHKGPKVKGFDVKITFHKEDKDIFVTDYRRFSFLLNNIYIPDNLKDKTSFENKLKELNITEDELKAYVRKDKFETHRTDETFLNICKEINKSFEKCITNNSDILQGCVWKINLSDIEKIELLNDTNYTYGSLNYIRSDGKRINWRQEFYKTLK